MSRGLKTLRYESLEGRLLFSVSPVGNVHLANVVSVGQQSAVASTNTVAILDNNVSVAVYGGRGGGDRDGVFFRLLDSQGAGMGPAHLVNQTIAGSQSNYAIAAIPGGGFVAAGQGRGIGDRVAV